jgi:ABC-type polysaccharide/polyol phosphate transport system ATPase subunit
MVISVRDLSKLYNIYERPIDRVLAALKLVHKHPTPFWAVRDVSFDIERGTTLGILGQNASGKSTLLKMLAGVLRPTSGTVEVHGKVSALLELGAGFNPEFTGRENVYMNGAIMGLSATEMDQRFHKIVAFAELGAFLDRPMKEYSSGMYVRLAFATAIHVDSDILLVDEALSVGDMLFQHRCINRIRQLQAQGVSIIYVSHDPVAVRSICDKALLLDRGRLLIYGETDAVAQRYVALIHERQQQLRETSYDEAVPTPAHSISKESGPEMSLEPPRIDYRHGNGDAEIVALGLFDEEGNKVKLVQPNQPMIVCILAQALRDLTQPIVGITLRNIMGLEITATNSAFEELQLPSLRAGQRVMVTFKVHLPYARSGSYTISPAIANGELDDNQMCDWIDNAYHFLVDKPIREIYGLIRIPTDVSYEIIEQPVPIAPS